MLSRQNPAPNIFQETEIYFQGNCVESICNDNKTLVGVLNFEITNNVINYQIIIFLFQEKKWIEYFRVKFLSSHLAGLICFIQNDSQLLFYRTETNFIEFVNINQKNDIEPFPNWPTPIQSFFQFSTETCSRVLMKLSNNKKMILIQTDQQYLIIDFTYLAIIWKHDRNGFQFKNRCLDFLDSNYLISLPQFYKGNLKFYNIKNTKVQKMLNAKFLNKFSFDPYLIYQIKDCKSLAFVCKQKISKLGRKVYLTLLTLLNIINLKLVRKMIIQNEGFPQSKFLGYSQRYVFYKLSTGNKQISLVIIDLQNFKKFKINNLKQIGQCSYKNSILTIFNKDLQDAQLWIAK